MGMGVWQASAEWNGRNDEISRAITTSRDLGVSLFDTAELYGRGRSEQLLGRTAKKIGRGELVIATKVHGANLAGAEVEKAWRASASRLGVKEIDLYQIHWPDPWAQIPLRETMKALEMLYLDGRIRAIGVSNFAVRDLEEARSFLSHTDIASNQVRYNLLQRSIEAEVLPYCRREKISILAWSPLAQGALTGKYRAGKVPRSDVRTDNELFREKNMGQIEKLVARLAPIAARRGRTVAQLALAWLATDPLVIPIPGAKNPRQAEENAGSAGVTLSREEISEIVRASDAMKLSYFPANT
jgi:aryl-alcohol dehydrogenase-like predicted oxidoreductase